MDKINQLIRFYGNEQVRDHYEEQSVKEIQSAFLLFINQIKSENEFISIEKQYIPIFIGKKGAAINKFKEDFNVEVKIENDDTIHLIGSSDLIQKAKVKK